MRKASMANKDPNLVKNLQKLKNPTPITSEKYPKPFFSTTEKQ